MKIEKGGVIWVCWGIKICNGGDYGCSVEERGYGIYAGFRV